jgi:hypothetical protein
MSGVEYPEFIDWVWLASDNLGQVGAFVTAGVAPIRIVSLDQLMEEDVVVRKLNTRPRETLHCRTPAYILESSV